MAPSPSVEIAVHNRAASLSRQDDRPAHIRPWRCPYSRCWCLQLAPEPPLARSILLFTLAMRCWLAGRFGFDCYFDFVFLVGWWFWLIVVVGIRFKFVLKVQSAHLDRPLESCLYSGITSYCFVPVIRRHRSGPKISICQITI